MGYGRFKGQVRIPAGCEEAEESRLALGLAASGRFLGGSFCFSARRLGQAVKEEIAEASSSLMSKTV